jgi:hypothetical protein
MRIAAVSLVGLLLGALPSVEAGSRPASKPPGNRGKPTPVASPAEKPKPDGDTGNADTKKAVKVSGTVVDRDGTPVAQAQVIFGSKSVWTGSDGAFVFEGPAVGMITVKKGGKSQEFPFSLSKGVLQPDPLVFK